MKKLWDFGILPALALAAGFGIGYQTPRYVELESTAPVYFVLNADLQAATLLAKQCKPTQERK